MSKHIHRIQPVWRRVDISDAIRAAKPDADGARRCYAVPGDLVYIEDRCRCGARRRATAVMGTPAYYREGWPVGSQDAEQTGPFGPWEGGL